MSILMNISGASAVPLYQYRSASFNQLDRLKERNRYLKNSYSNTVRSAKIYDDTCDGVETLAYENCDSSKHFIRGIYGSLYDTGLSDFKYTLDLKNKPLSEMVKRYDRENDTDAYDDDDDDW